MPIYEYLCPACGRRTEAWQKMDEDPLTDCPACGEADLRKLPSAAGILVKGDGKRVEPECGAGACPACLPD